MPNNLTALEPTFNRRCFMQGSAASAVGLTMATTSSGCSKTAHPTPPIHNEQGHYLWQNWSGAA